MPPRHNSATANAKTRGILPNLILWTYPLMMLLIQLAPPLIVLLCGVLVCLSAIFFQKLRDIFLIFGITAIGHTVWMFFTGILTLSGVSEHMVIIIGRFGLLGYITAFGIWAKMSPVQESLLRLGSGKAIIRFPFIWKGKPEPIWRFVLIFFIICAVPISILPFYKSISANVLWDGLLFTLINAVLEEILWRGLILPRVTSLAGEKRGLLITSLVFGLYHISLGFPIWACLIFAIGGFYMGGSAIISKGLAAPFMIHITVNIIFVLAGVIF